MGQLLDETSAMARSSNGSTGHYDNFGGHSHFAIIGGFTKQLERQRLPIRVAGMGRKSSLVRRWHLKSVSS